MSGEHSLIRHVTEIRATGLDGVVPDGPKHQRCQQELRGRLGIDGPEFT
jgi:hypothetical protein